MTARTCPLCDSWNYVAWTAGNKADGDKLAREMTALHGFATKAVKCAKYGYDVVRDGAA